MAVNYVNRRFRKIFDKCVDGTQKLRGQRPQPIHSSQLPRARVTKIYI